jgi:hypothetical protein
MENRRVQAAADEERRRRVKRRAKRGLVAGYIHELSARHATASREAEPRAVTVRSG